MTCLLEDRTDELGEDCVQRSEVGADDDYEEEDDSCELGELPAVRPLDPLKLGPHRLQELENPSALAALGAAGWPRRHVAATANAARTARAGGGRVVVGQLLVVDLEVGRRRFRVASREFGEADVLGRRAHVEVDVLLDLLALR